jgi:hypothetical protein
MQKENAQYVAGIMGWSNHLPASMRGETPAEARAATFTIESNSGGAYTGRSFDTMISKKYKALQGNKDVNASQQIVVYIKSNFPKDRWGELMNRAKKTLKGIK